MSVTPTEESILDKLDKVAPASLNQFDAFPKLPTTYKSRSGGRGFLTILVAFISFLLIVNDIGEYFFGWPVYRFGIDRNETSFMAVNIDLIVNMPCRCTFILSSCFVCLNASLTVENRLECRLAGRSRRPTVS